jgi:hypothetical protein
MLVILTDSQVLSPDLVCHDCLLANQQGQPRWHHGQLGCAKKSTDAIAGELHSGKNAQLYRCQMGFQVAEID